jgi:Flp pilus assembly protein CpaB
MGGRYKWVFWGAVLIAALATFGAYRLLDANGNRDIATVPVVVATRDIPQGQAIDRLEVSTAQWPAQAVPSGAFSNTDSLIGRVTRVDVFKGEAFVPGRLAPTGTNAGLELKIPPGQRAMAVRINDVAGISGLLQPNSRVDVLVTLRPQNSDREVAKLFMSNMLVLSVGTEIQRGSNAKPNDATTVTLAVTPAEAERLAVAMNTGSIQLVMRGYGEVDTLHTKGASSTDVFSQFSSSSPAPVATVATVERRAKRPSQVVVQKQAAAPPVAVVVAPPRPPDSATVNVYRAGRATPIKFDTTIKR